jgi:hypothetical protein
MVDKTKDSEDTVTLGLEGLRVGSTGLTTAFSKNGGSGGNDASKGAQRVVCAVIGSKEELVLGCQQFEERLQMQDLGVAKKVGFPGVKLGGVVCPCPGLSCGG